MTFHCILSAKAISLCALHTRRAASQDPVWNLVKELSPPADRLNSYTFYLVLYPF